VSGARVLESASRQDGSLTRSPHGGRRRVFAAIAAAVAVVVLAAGIVWLLLISTVLDVRTITVEQAGGLNPDRVLAAAAIPTGGPVLRVDTRAVAGRVLALPGVAEVTIARRPPHSVGIRVVPRVPVAVLRSGDGQLRLVDAAATVWSPIGAAPSDLPVLQDRDGTLDSAAVRTAVQVATSLPGDLHRKLRSLVPGQGAMVSLVLTDDRVVVWGDAGQAGEKARVTAALLGATRARYLDVSVPSVPVSRPTIPDGPLVPAAGAPRSR